MFLVVAAFIVVQFFSSMACASGADTGASNAHHLSNGEFVNTDGTTSNGEKNFFSVMLRFASGEFSAEPPKLGYEEFSKQSLAVPNFESSTSHDGAPTITWLGHAGVLLQISGLNLIFDPILSERASPISLFFGAKRKVRPPIQASDLPQINAILVSHNHFDHLDRKTVAAILKQSKNPATLCAYVPLKMGKWFKDIGFRCIHEFDWWDRVEINSAISVTAVPTHHWSRRGLFDRNHVLWAGFMVERTSPKPFKFLHLGDTGYSADFKEIGRRFGPIHLAAIPIGAYEPKDFMGPAHVSPAEAVKIFKDLRAESAIGIHWGTFELARESLDQPPIDLSTALQEASVPQDSFFVMKQGETKVFHQHQQTTK